MTDFDRAMQWLLRPDIEGGFANDPDDKGGMTKYGISKKSYPDVDIANLTTDAAAIIYKRDFWDKVSGDNLPWPLNVCAFDEAVNEGIYRATRNLQSAVGVNPDGVIGAATVGKARACNLRAAVERQLCARAIYYANTNNEKYEGGWEARTVKLALFVGKDMSS